MLHLADLSGSADLAAARASVLHALAGDPSHEASRHQILEFIDAHPDALHRSCLEGHLTGSAVVLDPQSRAVLLLFHAKVQRWLQPGGHADGDGNLARVALREAEEETGIDGLRALSPAIDLDVHVFHNAKAPEPDHLHLDVRHLVLSPPGAVLSGNHESEELRWFAADDLPALDLDSGTVRMVESALTALDGLDLSA
ncbi:MAG: NUDIX hydrolase [Acidimicrobiales bacterium]